MEMTPKTMPRSLQSVETICGSRAQRSVSVYASGAGTNRPRPKWQAKPSVDRAAYGLRYAARMGDLAVLDRPDLRALAMTFGQQVEHILVETHPLRLGRVRKLRV